SSVRQVGRGGRSRHVSQAWSTIRRRNLPPISTPLKKALKPYRLVLFSCSLSFSPFPCQEICTEVLLCLVLVIRLFLCPIGLLLAAILLGFARCLRLILTLLAFVRANQATFGICRPLGI